MFGRIGLRKWLGNISDLLVDQLLNIMNFVLLTEFWNLIEYVHAGNVIPKGYWTVRTQQ